MVVDDQEVMLKFAAAILERAGYVALIADSGEQAIEVARRHEGVIDILITDLQMVV